MAKLLKIGAGLTAQGFELPEEEVISELSISQQKGKYLSTTTLWLIWRFAFPNNAELYIASANKGDVTESTSSVVLVADINMDRVCEKRVKWQSHKPPESGKDETSAKHYIVHASFKDPHSELATADHYSTLSPIQLDTGHTGPFATMGRTSVIAAHIKSLLNVHSCPHDDGDGVNEEEPPAPSGSPAASYVPEGDSLWRACSSGILKAITDARAGRTRGGCEKVAVLPCLHVHVGDCVRPSTTNFAPTPHNTKTNLPTTRRPDQTGLAINCVKCDTQLRGRGDGAERFP
jgi:hypothetical protein